MCPGRKAFHHQVMFMSRETVGRKQLSRRQALVLLAGVPPLALGLASDSPRVSPGGRRATMIRLALLSFWHVHARDYVQQARANPATTITAVWDETPERGRSQAQALGVPFYENLPELLAQAEVDGVIVTTPTTMHREVIIAAAQAGKHIFTEKVLAPTLRECTEIAAAVEQAGVVLVVSLPRLSSGSTLAIKHILDRKLLGELTEVRTRLTHDGALKTRQHPQGWLPPSFFDLQQSAGGAMIHVGHLRCTWPRSSWACPRASVLSMPRSPDVPWRITRW